jgi:hypothetical protein
MSNRNDLKDSVFFLQANAMPINLNGKVINLALPDDLRKKAYQFYNAGKNLSLSLSKNINSVGKIKRSGWFFLAYKPSNVCEDLEKEMLKINWMSFFSSEGANTFIYLYYYILGANPDIAKTFKLLLLSAGSLNVILNCDQLTNNEKALLINYHNLIIDDFFSFLYEEQDSKLESILSSLNEVREYCQMSSRYANLLEVPAFLYEISKFIYIEIPKMKQLLLDESNLALETL